MSRRKSRRPAHKKPAADDGRERYAEFSEIYKDVLRLEGEQIQSKDLVGKEFVVEQYHRRPSKYSDNDYATVQIEMKGVNYFFYSGSKPLLDQLERTQDQMPYRARLIKKTSPKSGRQYLSFG